MRLSVTRAAGGDVDVLKCTERFVDRSDIGGEIVIAAGQCSIKKAPEFSERDALFFRQAVQRFRLIGVEINVGPPHTPTYTPGSAQLLHRGA